jgi:glycine/D-amino acid oxidase-like deaminating enzyme
MRNFDVVVVGNGAIGHAVAHAIALEAPMLRIALVGESSRPQSASVAAGAMLGAYSEVTANLRTSVAGRTKMQESLAAARIWPTWLETLNERISHAERVAIRPGTFMILNAVGGLLDSENYAAVRKTLVEQDEPFEDVDPRDIPGLNPWDMARPLRAMFIPGEGSVESDRLLSAYVTAAKSSDSITLINERAVRFRTTDSRILGVHTAANELLEAPKVVLASGVQTQTLLDTLPTLARRIPRLFSGGGSSLVFDPSWCYGDKRATTVPHVVRTPNRSLACGLHMIPRGDNHVYVGATNYLSMQPWSRPNMSDMHFLIECAIEQLNQDFVWAQLVTWNTGNRPVTVDSCPILGATSLEGLWVMSGTFRDGLHMSPLLAQQVMREIVYGESVMAPIFRPERPPISATKEEAVSEVVKHLQAAWSEHRGVNSTKMGLHYEMTGWLQSSASKWYAEMDSPYVLPPEFFPLVDGNPKNTEYFRTYYASLRRVWGAPAINAQHEHAVVA